MTQPDPGAPSSSGPPPGWQPPPPGWQPPPPGWQPAAPTPPTSYPTSPPPQPAAPAGAWVPARGMLGAAHRPGAVPLRPLGLGDIYDAAFRIIRFNPRATVGSAVLVAAVAMAVPVLVTAILSATVDLSFDGGGGGFGSGGLGAGDVDTDSLLGLVGSFGALGVGLVLSGFGTLFVTAMIAHVTAAAAVGRRLSLGEAWAATRGKRWRLVGLALLLAALGTAAATVYVVAWVVVVVAAHDSVATIVVWGVVSVPVVVALAVWFWVRVYYLAVTSLMLEPVGVWGALRRAAALTRHQFWRTLGIALLTLLVVGIASQVLGLPVGLLGQVATLAVPDRYALLALVVTQAVSRVVTGAFVTPFTSAVASVQYLDQRMRKEAYDVELMQQAGITGP